MESVTLAIAVFGSILALLLKPPKAFAIYIFSLLFYPSFLTVQIGTINLMVGRIIVSFLLLRCLANEKMRSSFRWNIIDTWVTFSAVVSLCIPLLAWKMPFLKTFENRCGIMMDTYFAYLAARFYIHNFTSLLIAVKWIAVGLVPLAFLGMAEASMGWQPYAAMRAYCSWHSWVVEEGEITQRFGFLRAVGPFGHSIMFGVAFVIFLPLIYSLRNETNWKKPAYLLSSVAIAGAMSSMSSGPWMMVILTVTFLAMEYKKQFVKPLIVIAILGIFFVSLLSNRRFYHVIASYADPLGGSGWHRARLIDLAVERIGEWWVAGYGGQDPGWGSSLGMTWTDITNHYIITGVTVGFLGTVTLVGMLTAALWKIYQKHNVARLKSWYWALGTIVVVLMISFNSCALFGQSLTLFYAIVGIIGSSVNFEIRSKGQATLVLTKGKSA